MIDDEESVLRAQANVLSAAGFPEPLRSTDADHALRMLEGQPVDAVLLDLLMPGATGETLLARLEELRPEVPVIVVTAVDNVETAVRCVQLGAFDYLVKPVQPDRLIAGLRRALALKRARSTCRELGDRLLDGRLRHPEHFSSMVNHDPKMHAIFLYVEAIAATGQPVLISGETGTGKELLARAVHDASGRSGQFHAVNVAGVDEAMVNDTLFGHMKGAYTGSIEARKGILAQAEGGTVLLDEIGDLSLASQVKLLRVLENGEYYPLGSDIPRRTTARFIMSTHRDIDALVAEGGFRNDLFFRISTYRVRIPPLRERRGDIPLLFDRFVAEAALEFSRRPPRVPEQLLQLLATYAFPGNVRELRAMAYAAVSHTERGSLSLSSVRDAVRSARVNALRTADGDEADTDPCEIRFGTRLPSLGRMTSALISEAMSRARGNQAEAASMLGISHQALSKRLKRAPATPSAPPR